MGKKKKYDPEVELFKEVAAQLTEDFKDEDKHQMGEEVQLLYDLLKIMEEFPHPRNAKNCKKRLFYGEFMISVMRSPD